MYLLVYVDDLILTGNQSTLLTSLIQRLNSEFGIKDLGNLTYFLGLEVTHMDSGIVINQSKYAIDILTRAKMLDAKPTPTPLSTNVSFVSAGTPFSNPTHYRSIVGALQYLTITRPDLSYAVNQVSQFLQAPTIDHFQEVKRILRYLKGTVSYGLHYNQVQSPSIIGYSDADRARCLETRRSTFGYSVEISSLGVLRNKQKLLVQAASRSTGLWLMWQQKLFGLLIYYKNFGHYHLQDLPCYVTTKVPCS
ncbi:putative RNA-directed DNA polymerase [Helianthus annuus]|uniref:uncharacterized mitochondrial protein AtMg00810-like n=1 Tax=Helianthus annuus TaxID=4232 RepID=UPI000B8FE6DA|nr:uncharacterized mitochondrial protein AtMg00810-like [Helianthus annuus]KAJ0520890.1 putative RNA-directed DNA polymerase [Helianthus annuus]